VPKAYAIIRDDLHILVGSGGNVGDPPAARTGLHLPGGSHPWGETALNGTLRETAEETGIALLAQDRLAEFTLILNTRQVTFVVFEVFNLAALIAGRNPPHITDVHDEPFANVATLPIANCAANAGFSALHGTDWFAAGLNHARGHGHI
jgi:ADP-ribose pyrophosphatase YjhB (NUDIX family)